MDGLPCTSKLSKAFHYALSNRQEFFNYLEDDTTVFEKQPMQRLAMEGQLKSFYHSGFWQCMDTQREMNKLETLWQSGNAPWKIWKD